MQNKPDLSPEVLRQLYLVEGRTLQQIGDAYGRSLKWVWKRCKRHGIPRRPGCAVWKGGRLIDKTGYVLIHQPHHPQANHSGYVREHRLVMEKKLGRFLKPDEVVHHKDDNRENNDPSNLELFPSNTEHLRQTLKGRTPKWTADGLRRIQLGLDKIRCTQLPSPSEIAEMYKTMTADDIARKFGCSQRPVASRLRAAGVQLRSNKDRYAYKWPSPNEVREMLKTKTPRQIAEQFGKKVKSLYAWLARHGIDWKRETHCSRSHEQTPIVDRPLAGDAPVS